MIHNIVKKKLISLFTGELASSIVFVLVLLSLKSNYNLELLDPILLFPFVTLIFILLQGSYYWLYCIRRINKKQVNQPLFRTIYRNLKIVDLILIMIYPGVIVLNNSFGINSIFRFESLLGLFFYIFSIVELINYFYIRLSYGNLNDIVLLLKFKKLIRSSLNKELYR